MKTLKNNTFKQIQKLKLVKQIITIILKLNKIEIKDYNNGNPKFQILINPKLYKTKKAFKVNN